MSNKISKNVQALNAEIDARVALHTEALHTITQIECSNAEVSTDAERAAMRHLHHTRKLEGLRKLDSAKSAQRAIALLNSFQERASGNDIEKVRSIADAVAHNDPERMYNSGIKNAFLMLARLTQKHPQQEEFSWTDFATVGSVKDNVKTSLKLLSKLAILEQIKAERGRVIGYRVRNRDALDGLLSIHR